MAWHLRVRRRLRVAPGIYLNLDKRSTSVTFGVRGAHVTVGPKHVRKTVGLPGTGISYSETTRLPPHHPQAPSTLPRPEPVVSLAASAPTR